jgi:hypothetical protein
MALPISLSVSGSLPVNKENASLWYSDGLLFLTILFVENVFFID